MNGRFAAGASVVVQEREVTGHVRTPGYIRGKRGVVERICGAFQDPEQLAYGRSDAARIALYRVRFSARDVWHDYAGSKLDTIDVEIYEHWLAADGEG